MENLKDLMNFWSILSITNQNSKQKLHKKTNQLINMKQQYSFILQTVYIIQIKKMSSRQNHQQQNSYTGRTLQQIKDLKLQIELKNHEIDDLKFELNTLKKKQSIWYHLDQNYQKENIEEERKAYTDQIQKLKSQIYAMVAELEQKTSMINEQKQKINDLKEYNQELKKLNDKIQIIHRKEMQVLKSTLDSTPELLQLRKDKQKLEIALSKCDIIGKQMQQYYMNQVQSLKKQLEQQQYTIRKLQNSSNVLQTSNKKKQQQLKQLKNKLTQNEQKQKQYDFNELLKKKNQQKKYQIIIQQIKQKYQKQISQLKQQLKFLSAKMDHLSDCKNYCQGLTTSILTQSKAIQSTTNDSFRFTQNNSFSSSIKESLTKRDGPLRTPSKTCRKSNHFGLLLDRTNLC